MAESEKEKKIISKPIKEFIEELEKNLENQKQREKIASNAEEEEDEMEDTGESMARLYEKVRNLIEYKDDHLIKKYAIERILRRNLLIELRREDITEQFLNELVLAGYIERENISGELKTEVKKTLSKYQKAMKIVGGFDSRKWLVAIGACEIEEILFPNPSRYALARAMFETVRRRIEFRGRVPEKKKTFRFLSRF